MTMAHGFMPSNLGEIRQEILPLNEKRGQTWKLKEK